MSATPSAAAPGLFATVGILRVMLGLTAVFLAPLALFADREPEGWLVLPVYIAPVLAILLFWGLLLDLIMARVFMAEKAPEAAAPYRRVLRYDGVLLGILVFSWTPFFYGLVA